MSKCGRRRFLKQSLALAAALPTSTADLVHASGLAQPPARSASLPTPRVALARCRTYQDADVRGALDTCFNLLGGLKGLANGKTVTVKVNLTGHNFAPFRGLPPGESYMTHFSTAYHLAALLCGAGARRVRFVESIGSRTPLEPTLVEAGWDLRALGALGTVIYENTRNRGSFESYAHLRVPRGRMFASFELNRAYADTDVLVSLAKLKQHETTGVTLTMKNMFGITPNSMYGGKPGDEDSTAGRGPIHDPGRYVDLELPGLKPAFQSTEAGVRVPYTIADLCAARPVDLAIIDGISAMTGGENPYSSGPKTRIVRPGVMIVGRNPVSVDAVGASVMGFDPRAARGTGAFARGRCENHLLLAEQAGLGTADLARIDVRGVPLADARHPYM
jgi:uncharacterized protein (DUF362 family)